MNVYWSVTHSDAISFIKYEEPDNLLQRMRNMKLDLSNKNHDFRYCPAFRDCVQNTYILKFPVDYNLTFDFEKNVATSSLYDQNFYNSTLLIRSVKPPLCSFKISYIFIAEDSLEMSVSSPHFSEGEFASKAMIIPGKFNIGKWSRPVDCSFMLKDGFNTINFN